MKILVTGARGFVGKNLIADLRSRGYDDILEYDLDTKESLLDKYCKECEFVYHLAGVNRPKDDKEFMEGNFGFTSKLLDALKKHENKSPILITSSIQAVRDNAYGKSKKAGENLIFNYGQEVGVETYVYRLNNLFGKWSKPNYNTVIATFCYNIVNNIEIRIDNPEAELTLSYIDDVVNEFVKAVEGHATKDKEFCIVENVHTAKIGQIADLLYEFKKSRTLLSVPNMKNAFEKKLYSTYLSFLPKDQFSYDLKMNVDHRGSFTEVIRTPDRGQVSVNISKAGITKGNHWHHTKNEKFLVVSGHGVIKLRSLNEDDIIEYSVSSEKLQIVDIPPGYVHNIENVGSTDLVVLMWVNEMYDPQNADTHYLEV